MRNKESIRHENDQNDSGEARNGGSQGVSSNSTKINKGMSLPTKIAIGVGVALVLLIGSIILFS